jgi:hypothetical protein
MLAVGQAKPGKRVFSYAAWPVWRQITAGFPLAVVQLLLEPRDVHPGLLERGKAL